MESHQLKLGSCIGLKPAFTDLLFVTTDAFLESGCYVFQRHPMINQRQPASAVSNVRLFLLSISFFEIIR